MQKITHSVMFTLKHPAGAPEVQQFLRDGKEILTQIPTVIDFQVLVQVSKKNPYQFGFTMNFETQEDYDFYNNHPLHVGFVKERWETEVVSFLEADFIHYV